MFKSIPWEQLRDLGDTSRRRRIWYLMGGAAVVAVLLFSMVRTFSAPDPQIIAPTTMPPTTAFRAPTLPPESETPLLLPPLDPQPGTGYPVNEADLMAGEGPWMAANQAEVWQAASYSEWFALELFNLDGSGRSVALERWLPDMAASETPDALSYGEWAKPLWVEALGDGRWRAVVALRRLVSTDGIDYSRLPTQAVEVVIDMGAGVPAIVDLPRFVPLPEPAPAQWWAGELWETPPAAVARTARDELLLSEAGDIVGNPVISRTSDAWRVEWAVVDPVGITWPVSLWIGSEGTPVSAGG